MLYRWCHHQAESSVGLHIAAAVRTLKYKEWHVGRWVPFIRNMTGILVCMYNTVHTKAEETTGELSYHHLAIRWYGARSDRFCRLDPYRSFLPWKYSSLGVDWLVIEGPNGFQNAL